MEIFGYPKKKNKEYIYSIRNFLTLALSYNSFPNNIIGKLENKNKTDDQKKKYQNIHILYKVFGFSKIQKEISKTDMLFTFKDVKTDFKEYLNNWFEIINEIKPVFNLYFSMIYNDNIFLEQLFLSSVKALEIYHRKIYGGKYLTGKKYKKLYNKLINSIPKNTQKSLKDKLKTSLKYGNEYSLRKRLKIIYNEHKSIINNFLINKNYFIAKVVDTRNYLTHYDKKLENKIAKGKNLAIITRKIKLILEICFLKEIGVEDRKIKSILTQKYKYLIDKK